MILINGHANWSGCGDWWRRRISPFGWRRCKALYNTRDLDNVPTLIYALGDPDPRIVQKSRDALRLLSRKVDGFGLPEEPTEGAKLEAIEKWKQWYLAIRPNAQFLN